MFRLLDVSHQTVNRSEIDTAAAWVASFRRFCWIHYDKFGDRSLLGVQRALQYEIVQSSVHVFDCAIHMDTRSPLRDIAVTVFSSDATNAHWHQKIHSTEVESIFFHPSGDPHTVHLEDLLNLPRRKSMCDLQPVFDSTGAILTGPNHICA